MKLVFSKTLDGKKTRARIEGLAGFQGLGDNEAAARQGRKRGQSFKASAGARQGRSLKHEGKARAAA